MQSPHQRKIAAEFSAVRLLPTFLHLVICFLRVSFQMKPLMRRKARISNPTFKTSPHICSKSGGITLRSSLIPLLAPQRLQERFRRVLWLSSMAWLIKPFTLSLWASAWAQQSKHSGLIPSRALSCKVIPKITLHSAFLQCSREHNRAKLRSTSSRSLRNTP